MSSLDLMSEGDSFQGLWDGLDSLSLGILFGYLQACSYLENFIMGLRTVSPGTRALEAPETRSSPPFYFNLLILQDYPIGGCHLGLLKRANGDRKHSEVILACLTSSHQRKKC